MQDNPKGTGYRVTYKDFVALLSDPAWKGSIGPMVEKWFNCTLEAAGGQPQLRSSTGEILSLATVHEMTQNDREKQYALYQAAMDLWR